MKAGATPPEERFWELAERVLAEPGVTRSTMMGLPCLRKGQNQVLPSTRRRMRPARSMATEVPGMRWAVAVFPMQFGPRTVAGDAST